MEQILCNLRKLTELTNSFYRDGDVDTAEQLDRIKHDLLNEAIERLRMAASGE